VSEVAILIIDDDVDSQRALRYVLDSEGWRVRVAPLVSEGLAELANRDWTLVIVNIAMTDLGSPAFNTLRELAQADADAATGKRVRVLFLVPELVASQAQPLLEVDRIPYVLKPYHLHDFLEKISDLLMEAQAIPQPIRQMRAEPVAKERRPQKDRQPAKERRQVTMFASRKDYQMTEEEIAEYERQEEEERKKKQKKKEELGNL
jgi:DNA-binding response OmpR family regulator